MFVMSTCRYLKRIGDRIKIGIKNNDGSHLVGTSFFLTLLPGESGSKHLSVGYGGSETLVNPYDFHFRQCPAQAIDKRLNIPCAFTGIPFQIVRLAHYDLVNRLVSAIIAHELQ